MQQTTARKATGKLPSVAKIREAAAAALPEARELKKREYHLTKWPHADLADKIIEAITSDSD